MTEKNMRFFLDKKLVNNVLENSEEELTKGGQ